MTVSLGGMRTSAEIIDMGRWWNSGLKAAGLDEVVGDIQVGDIETGVFGISEQGFRWLEQHAGEWRVGNRFYPANIGLLMDEATGEGLEVFRHPDGEDEQAQYPQRGQGIYDALERKLTDGLSVAVASLWKDNPDWEETRLCSLEIGEFSIAAACDQFGAWLEIQENPVEFAEASRLDSSIRRDAAENN